MNSSTSYSQSESQIAHTIPPQLNLDGLTLYHQPIVEAQSHTSIEALEVLSRPKGINPVAFFRLALEYQCLPLVDTWVFEKTVFEAQYLLQKGQHIWINISPSTLMDRAAIERFCHVLSTLPNPGLVGFELTENEIITDMRLAIEHASRLRDAGAKVILDDFGTGGANICLLLDLPYDVVKLDRSVFQRTYEEPRFKRLLTGLCREIQRYGARVVAEGVEHEGMAEEALAMGCELIQGYFIEMPSPLADRINRVRESVLPVAQRM